MATFFAYSETGKTINGLLSTQAVSKSPGLEVEKNMFSPGITSKNKHEQ